MSTPGTSNLADLGMMATLGLKVEFQGIIGQ